MTEFCSSSIPGVNIFRSRKCSRKGTIERDGKLYCTQHDPVAVNARRKERDAVLTARYESRVAAREQENRKQANLEARAALVDELVVALQMAPDTRDFLKYRRWFDVVRADALLKASQYKTKEAGRAQKM